jgi:hypothetical protein
MKPVALLPWCAAFVAATLCAATPATPRGDARWRHDPGFDEAPSRHAAATRRNAFLRPNLADTTTAPGGSPQAARAAASGDGECPAFVFRDGFDRGSLAQAAIGAPVEYVTRGGYAIRIDLHTITVRDPQGMNRIEHWGDPHENLNGKHIKDWGGAPGWETTQRTVLLGDGAKVTMTSTGAQGLVVATSIYDHDQNVQVSNIGNVIEHHGLDAADTLAREQAQHDGETSVFVTDARTAQAGYTTIYNEDADFERVGFDVPLGTTGGCDNPNQVRDFFDDPRLGHT